MGDFSWAYDDLATLTGDKSYLKNKPSVVKSPSAPLSRDEDLAVRTIIGEAKGEGAKGWEGVADVIRNRAKGSGKSFGDVVLAPNQFEPWTSRRKELEGYDPNSSTYQQVARTVLPVLRGEKVGPAGDATHFYSPSSQAAMGRKAPSWDNGKGVDVGRHRFFNLGYSGKGIHGTDKAAPVPNKDYSWAANDLKDLLGDTPPPKDYSWAQDDLKQLTGDVPKTPAPPTNPVNAPAPATTAPVGRPNDPIISMGDPMDKVQPLPNAPYVADPMSQVQPLPNADPNKPVTMTNLAQQTVPETALTMQKQMTSALAPNSPKKAVYFPDPKQIGMFGDAVLSQFTAVPTPEGGTVLVNNRAAWDMGLKTADAIKKRVAKQGFNDLLGNVVEAPTDGSVPAVTALDGQGNELHSTATPTEADAQKQADLNSQMYPGSTTVPTTAPEIIANRDPSVLAQAPTPNATPPMASPAAPARTQPQAALPQGTVDANASAVDPAILKASEDVANQYNAQAAAGAPAESSGYAPKVVGKEGYNPNATAYVYQSKAGESEEDAGTRALLGASKGQLTESQARAYTKRQIAKGGLTNEAFKPGGKFAVAYQNLEEAGMPDVKTNTEMEQAQSRVENPVSKVTPELEQGTDWLNRTLKDVYGETGGAISASIMNALGGKAAGELAGLARYVERLNPVSNAQSEILTNGKVDTTKDILPGFMPDYDTFDKDGKPITKKAESFGTDAYNALQQMSKDLQAVQEMSGEKEITIGADGRPVVSDTLKTQLLKKGIDITGDLVRLYALSKVIPGGGGGATTVAGKVAQGVLHGAGVFGASSALGTAGQGASDEEVRRQGAKGTAIGGLFGIAPSVGNAVTDVAGTVLNKAVPNLVKEGITLGTIAGGTYGIAKLAGDKDEAAIQEAIVNSLFHLGPAVFGKTVELVGKGGAKFLAKISKKGEVQPAPVDAKPDFSVPSKFADYAAKDAAIQGEAKVETTSVKPPTEPLGDEFASKVETGKGGQRNEQGTTVQQIASEAEGTGVRSTNVSRDDASGVSTGSSRSGKDSQVNEKTTEPYTAVVHRGISSKTPVDEGMYGKGEYWTTSEKYAADYGKEGEVKSGQITLNKPFISDGGGDIGRLKSEIGKTLSTEGMSAKEANEALSQAVREHLEKQGYDGIVVKTSSGDEVVAFHPDTSVASQQAPKSETQAEQPLTGETQTQPWQQTFDQYVAPIRDEGGYLSPELRQQALTDYDSAFKQQLEADKSQIPAHVLKEYAPHLADVYQLTKSEFAKDGGRFQEYSDLQRDINAKQLELNIAQKKLRNAKKLGTRMSADDAFKRLAAEMQGLKQKQDRFHKDAVKQALAEGKDVPPEVLADYPDLAQDTSTPSTQAEDVTEKGTSGDTSKEAKIVGGGEITREGQQRDEARRAAETDPLTGLANRSALDKALPKAEADPNTSVIAFDANNFGKINKVESQEAGDEALKNIGKAINQAAQEHGVGRVFRRGGDEFVVIAPKEVAEKIQKRAEELYGVSEHKDGLKISLTGTVGDTFNEADAVLQTAKAERKARIAIENGTPPVQAADALVTDYETRTNPQNTNIETPASGKGGENSQPIETAATNTGEPKVSTEPSSQGEVKAPAADAGGNGSEATKLGWKERYGESNTLVSKDTALKDRETLRNLLGKDPLALGSGLGSLDPQVAKALIRLGTFHAEAGAKEIGAFTKAMVDDLGESVRKHIDELHEGVMAKYGKERQFTPEPSGEPSSIMHAEINADRASRGVDELLKRTKKANPELHKEVQDIIAKDPDAPLKTFEKYKANPKAVPNDVEGVLLNAHKIDMKREVSAVARRQADAIDSGDPIARANAEMDRITADQKFDEAEKVAFQAGRERGAALQSQKLFADEQFEYTSLVRDMKVAKGRDLTDVERRDLQRIADEHKAETEKLNAVIAGKDEEIANIQAQIPPRHILDVAENYVKKLKSLADKERERLAARGNVFQSGIDPRDLKSMAIIGADHLANMSLDFAKFSDRMVGEFGEKVKPHLEKIFEDAKKVLAGGHEALKSDADVMARTLKATKTRMENRIKELENAIAKGERIQAKKRSVVKSDADLDALRARKQSLQEDYDATFPKEPREPMTDSQRLKALEKRLEKKQKSIQDKIDNSDFSETAPRKPLNPQAIKADASSTAEDRARAQRIQSAQAAVGRIEKKFARMKDQAERASEPVGKWLQRKAVNFVRASMLSAITVVEKLGAASMGRVASRPMKQAIGAVASKVPGLRGIARTAPIEGSKGLMNDLYNESHAAAKALTTGVMDMGRTWSGKGTELTNAFGKSENYMESGKYLPFQVSQLVGLMHDGLKAPAFRSEYEGVLGNLIMSAKMKGEPLDGESLFLLQQKAYEYAQRAKFNETRAMTTAITNTLKKLDNNEMTTVQAIATVARIIMPIHKISTNVVAQSFESSPFGLAKGIAKAAKANVKGLESLSPEQADIIMRNIKNGSLGTAMWALGLFAGGKVIGSFYQKFDADKDKDKAKYNTVQIDGVRVPSALLHLPEFNSMFMGATMKRIYEEQREKGIGQKEAAYKGAVGGATDLAKEVPGAEAIDSLTNIYHAVVGGTDEQIRDARYGIGNFVAARTTPGILRNAAEFGDQDPKGHYTFPFMKESNSRHVDSSSIESSVKDQIQKNIPYWRNQLPLSQSATQPEKRPVDPEIEQRKNEMKIQRNNRKRSVIRPRR